MTEEWRAIPGYEGWYEVSSHGRVRRCARTVAQCDGRIYPVRERLLNAHKHSNGYRMACLRTESGVNGRMQYIHRLVAMAFLPRVEGTPDVNHLDLDKTNNQVENLEWCTKLRNSSHAASAGRFHGRTNANMRKKLTPEQADRIKATLGDPVTIAASYGVSEALVRLIWRGLRWGDPKERDAWA